MDKHEKAIGGFLTAGMAMESIRTALIMLIYYSPEPILKLMQNPGEEIISTWHEKLSTLMMLRPLLHFGIMLVLFLLLRAETKKLSALSGVMPVLIPIGSVVLSLIGTFVNLGANRLMAVRYGAEAIAAYSSVNAAASLITIVFSPALLLFAIAAGANWFRRRQMQP